MHYQENMPVKSQFENHDCFFFLQQSKKIEDAKLARDFQATLQEFQKVQQLASERESTYMPSGAPTSAVIEYAMSNFLA